MIPRDYERHPAVSEVIVRWVAINTITGASLADARPPRSNDTLSRPPVDLLQHILRAYR